MERSGSMGHYRNLKYLKAMDYQTMLFITKASIIMAIPEVCREAMPILAISLSIIWLMP